MLYSFYRLVDKVLSLVQSCSISLHSDPANVNSKMKHVSLTFWTMLGCANCGVTFLFFTLSSAQDSSDKEGNRTPCLIEESELRTLCDMVEHLT